MLRGDRESRLHSKQGSGKEHATAGLQGTKGPTREKSTLLKLTGEREKNKQLDHPYRARTPSA